MLSIFSCKQHQKKSNEIIKVDSLTNEGTRVIGTYVDSNREGKWLILNDSIKIERIYKENFKIGEKIFLKDSLIYSFGLDSY